MTRADRWLCIVLGTLAVLIVCEAEAQQPAEPRCDVPVVSWPMDGPQIRTCGEWRCLTRRAWAEQVMAPERGLTRCMTDLATERDLTSAMVEAHRAALEDAAKAREAEQRMRRRRWAYVAAGAAGGVLVSAGVVWAGVQVVGAR